MLTDVKNHRKLASWLLAGGWSSADGVKHQVQTRPTPLLGLIYGWRPRCSTARQTAAYHVNTWRQHIFCCCAIHLPLFKPPPPVGAGGGYVFSGRPSVPLSVHASVIHMVVLCFRDISSICWRIFAKLLSLVHLGTEMNWLDFGVKRSKFKVTPSRRRRTALDATVECNFF